MRTSRMALAGLVALSAGCGASRSSPSSPSPKQGTPPTEAAEAGRSEIRVQVDNQNFSDMNVYVLDRGTRVLLGAAPGLSKTTLVLPSGVVGGDREVRLLADPIGGARTIPTPKLIVGPGQSVYWTIGSDPANSFASAG